MLLALHLCKMRKLVHTYTVRMWYTEEFIIFQIIFVSFLYRFHAKNDRYGLKRVTFYYIMNIRIIFSPQFVKNLVFGQIQGDWE